MDNDEYKSKNYPKALEETFVEIDYLLISEEGHDLMRQIVLEMKKAIRGNAAKLDIQEEREIKSLAFCTGCTSCVVLITQTQVICANSGDSRAVIGYKDGKLKELSFDHKPENPGETKRVQAGGGFIEDGRVQGVIAVSRALGDWEYKNPGLLK